MVLVERPKLTLFVSNFKQTSLDEATDPWGVKVESVEVYVHYVPFLDYIILSLIWFTCTQTNFIIITIFSQIVTQSVLAGPVLVTRSTYCKFLLPIPRIFYFFNCALLA